MDRIILIDNIRGVAFILMVIQHIFYFYDVSNDYKTELSLNSLISGSGSIARTLFILLAGYSLKLSNDKSKSRVSKSLEIGIHALIITLVTYLLYPNYFVIFGVLHFIALSTYLLYFIVEYKNLYLPLIIILLLIKDKIPPINPMIDTVLGTHIHYNSIDHFGLIDWLPIMLIGMLLYDNLKLDINIKILNEKNILTKLGQNSLNLYTIHVILLLLFYKYCK